MDPEPNFLDSLNDAQLEAVTHAPNIPLQILAGPGSGKTRVLTSRIAHLILNCHLQPKSICAVTFTNKAANEMRERLIKLIGKESTSQLRMGTFHSLCARFLRRYCRLVDLPENFTVCDATESKKIVTNLLKPYAAEIKSAGLSIEPGTVASMISKAKSTGQSAKNYLKKAKESERATREKYGIVSEHRSFEHIVGEIFVEYEATLKRNKALDFDDLLIYGVKLFTRNEETVLWCRHILVDEFQDTNVTQYQLMHVLAHAHCVSIVGDPDQSIYGWRSADVGNLSKMRKDFPQTKQVLLEENYRSTGAILKASLAIVAQDEKRIDKSLYTSHPAGFTPILYQLATEHEEAAFIAVEIKRLVAEMGGTLRWGDFVILLRYNALSRIIESALQKERIPSRILGGHKFFERLEVKDLLAYLQLVDNPNFTPAFIRAVNVPGRGIGEKTLSDITAKAEQCKKSQLEVVEGIYDMEIPDNKPAIKKKVTSFVTVIRTLRKMAQEGTLPSDLIRNLIELIQYQEHLRKTQSDWQTRWENVNELITFASEVEAQNQADNSAAAEAEDELELDVNTSPLRQFLQASMLSSEGDNQSEENNNDKVTISTCHAAKGLEWPVVMIPSVDSTTYPFIRSEDEDEERRLLYVACTRAKTLLYITRAVQRMTAGETKSKHLSSFISSILETNHSIGQTAFFNQHVPYIEDQDRAIICKVLERSHPDEIEIKRRVAEFVRSGRQLPAPIYWTYRFANYSGQPQPAIANTINGPEVVFKTPTPSTSHESQQNFVAASSTIRGYSAPTSLSSQQAYHAASQRQILSPPSGAQSVSYGLPFLQGPAALSNPGQLQPIRSSSPVGSSRPVPARVNHQVIRFPPSLQGQPSQQQPSGLDLFERQPRSRPSSSHTVNEFPRAPILHHPSTIYNAPPVQRPIQKGMHTTDDQNRYPVETHSSNSAPVTPPSDTTVTSPITCGVKRRLGMGRTTGGYSNKKFKPPT